MPLQKATGSQRVQKFNLLQHPFLPSAEMPLQKATGSPNPKRIPGELPGNRHAVKFKGFAQVNLWDKYRELKGISVSEGWVWESPGNRHAVKLKGFAQVKLWDQYL